jgi:hypothetical protein
MSTSSDDEVDDTQIRFQEAHGARLFRQGKPRAVLEVKSPNISTGDLRGAFEGLRQGGLQRAPFTGAQEVTEA